MAALLQGLAIDLPIAQGLDILYRLWIHRPDTPVAVYAGHAN